MKKIWFWLPIFVQLQGLVASAGVYTHEVPGDPYDPSEKILLCETKNFSSTANFYVALKKNPIKRELYLTVEGVENLAKPVEFHHGNLYVIVMKDGYSQNNWNREIWRYGPNKKGVKLVGGRLNGDYCVSDDEKFIALGNSGPDFDDQLDILNGEGKLLKTFMPKDLGLAKSYDSTPLDILGFEGHSLWMCDGEAADDNISNFVKFDLDTQTTHPYPVQKNFSDAAFNLKTHLALYDDYPFSGGDYDTDQAFKATKRAVHLYLYDVETGKDRVIAQSEAKAFEAGWVETDIVEYDDPKGKGRVRKKIGGIKE